MKVTEIVVYSHGFYVVPANEKVKHTLIQYCKTLGQWEVVKRPPDWRPIKVLSRIYAGATKDRKEFRFHITLLEEVVRALKGAGIYSDEIKIRKLPVPKPTSVTFETKVEMVARDYQEDLIDFLANPDQPIKVTNLQTGKGKAQPLDAKIRVPGGWSTMGEMKVGHEVIAADGTVTQVTGVHPQGKQQLYKITFADGRSTEACADHLWSVMGLLKGSERVISTREMIEIMGKPNPRLFIPLIDSESEDLEKDYADVKRKLHKRGKVSVVGRITHVYSNDIAWLKLRSYELRYLGGIAKISKVPTWKDLDCKYVLKYRIPKLLGVKRPKLRIDKIEPSRVDEAQCISISHPDSLYVTDDFIVTHNTFTALSAMIRLGVRTVIQLRGGYVGRWMEDLKGLFKFKKGELLVVRGRDALQSIINQAKAGELEVKVIVITSKTLYNYFKEYEANPKDNIYGVRPEELYKLLGIGLRIVDEAHEDYHHNFRTDLYSNIQSSIHLSATLQTEDPFRQRMYDIALPKEFWHVGVEYDAYIGVKALMFETEDPDRLRTQERGQDMYSHNAYEKSIMKDKKMLRNYLNIITYPVFKYFLEDDWQPGQKCLIFCGMVEMCEIVRDHLRSMTSEIIINEFVSETDESVLAQSDIIVSTVESCGTAQDIPNLKVSLLTRALRKLETNEQVKGRLRKLKKWPDITPLFLYLVNTSVPKHMDYHEVKKEQFRGKCAFHEEERLPIDLETE